MKGREIHNTQREKIEEQKVWKPDKGSNALWETGRETESFR